MPFVTIGLAAALVAALGCAQDATARPARAAAQRTAATASDTAATVAWVDVSVASVWVSPHKPRAVDRPALTDPVDIPRWLRHLSVHDRAGLGSRLETQVLYGDTVIVLRTADGWSRVRVPDQTGGAFPDGIIGWVPSRQLTMASPTLPAAPAATEVATVTSPTATLSYSIANVRRTLPLSYATELPVARTTSNRVYVYLPGGSQLGSLSRTNAAVHVAGSPALTPTGSEAVAQADRFQGLSYLWAGTSAYGFDCSGLVSSVYRQLGVILPRDALDQSRFGTPVSRTKLRPGDLVFFSSNHHRSGIHHVAMYVGHGRIVQAPHTGAAVSQARLWHFGLTSQYWGATRLLP